MPTISAKKWGLAKKAGQTYMSTFASIVEVNTDPKMQCKSVALY